MVVIIVLKKYIEFCKKETLLCISIILIIFVIFGSHLFSRNMCIDTHSFLLNPTMNYNWLDIGRFGLVLLKYIVGLGSFNLYYANGLLMLILVITSIYWAYFIKKYTKCNNNFVIALSIFMIFGSPIYAEQFYFIIQSVEVVLGILMTLISVDLAFNHLSTNKIRYLVASIILNIISFGIYQAFIPLYISLVIGIYILNYRKEASSAKKEFINFRKVIAPVIGNFILSFIIYYIISKLFITSDYLTASISWGKESFLQVLKNICGAIYSVIKGGGIFYDLSFLVMSILLIIVQLKNNYKKNIFYKLKNIAVTAVFLITPFFLTIYSGSIQVVRSYLNLPFVIALGFIIILEFLNIEIKHPKFKKCALGFLYIVVMFFSMKQYYISSRLYYAEDIRNDSDLLLANNIYKDVSALVDDVSNYHIFIIGFNEINLPASAYEGDMMGKSLFNVHAVLEPYHFWSTSSVQDIWKIEGKKAFKDNDKELSKKVIDYIDSEEDIPNYPNKDSIIIKDDLVIVKLSDDYCNYKKKK